MYLRELIQNADFVCFVLFHLNIMHKGTYLVGFESRRCHDDRARNKPNGSVADTGHRVYKTRVSNCLGPSQKLSRPELARISLNPSCTSLNNRVNPTLLSIKKTHDDCTRFHPHRLLSIANGMPIYCTGSMTF